MKLLSVGSLVVDEKHILLFACYVSDHGESHCLLLHMPYDFIFSLFGIEGCTGEGPELGEVELIALSFVPEGGKELTLKRNGPNLRAASPYIEDAVFQLLPAYSRYQVTGGEPYPGGSEILSPVLVAVAIGAFRGNYISLSIPDYNS